jgi:hypothetical protein
MLSDPLESVIELDRLLVIILLHDEDDTVGFVLQIAPIRSR